MSSRFTLCFSSAIITLVVMGLLLAGAPAVNASTPKLAYEIIQPSIPAFLREDLSNPNYPTDDLRYALADLDLDGDGDSEVFAYVMGRYTCGTGGCTLYIFENADGGYRLINRIPAVPLPVSVLPSRSDGWRDLSIRVFGGGEQEGFNLILSFDGQSYPNAKAGLHARRVDAAIPDARIIEIDNEGTPLFQAGDGR